MSNLMLNKLTGDQLIVPASNQENQVASESSFLFHAMSQVIRILHDVACWE